MPAVEPTCCSTHAYMYACAVLDPALPVQCFNTAGAALKLKKKTGVLLENDTANRFRVPVRA